MPRRLYLISAVALIVISIIATLNATPNVDPSSLIASYSDRFKESNSKQIWWAIPRDLPNLVDYSDVIIHGIVTRRTEPPSGLLLDGAVFEVKVHSYLKAVDTSSEFILILQIVGEAGNPVVQPGDECVFFVTLHYEQKPGPGVVYSLGGEYTRYVVYEERVYTVASLNPQNSSELSIRSEPLTPFLIRVRNMVR